MRRFVVLGALAAAAVVLAADGPAKAGRYNAGPAKAGHYSETTAGPAKAGHYSETTAGPAKAGHYNETTAGPAKAGHYSETTAGPAEAGHHNETTAGPAEAGRYKQTTGGPADSGRDQWPEFRGPHGRGTSPGPVPLTWGEGKNVAWKTAIHGRGWSSPVILGNQIWLTTATDDGRDLFAIAIDRDSGRILHDLKLFHVENPQYAHPFNSYASPTPVIEPGRVYVTFGSPGTAAIDTRTAKVLWERRDLQCNHFRGAGSSPIVYDDLLIMHFDGSDVQYVIALDKNTGKTAWQTQRSIDYQDLEPDGKPKADGDFRKAFSTPLVVMANGQPVLVSIGSKATYGYDPRNGEELWRIEERGNFSGSTRPVAGHGLIFYPTGFNTGQLFAVRPDGRGDVTATKVVWKVNKGVPNKPSVLLVGDVIFMVTDAGILTCVEARTGDVVWKARLEGSYSASPVWSGGRVYFFSEEGRATVIDDRRAFKVVAENYLDDGFMASPAIVGRALFLRTRSHLYRIEEPRGP